MNLASLRRDRDLRDIAADLGKAVDEIDEVVRKNERTYTGPICTRWRPVRINMP